MNPARRASVWNLLGGAVVATSVGVIGVILHRTVPVRLALPDACAAAPELLATWVARLRPAIHLGAWLEDANAVLTIAGIAGFTTLARLVSGRWWIAAAVGVTVALLPDFAPELAPFHGALFAVSAWTLVLLARDVRPTSAPRSLQSARWTWLGFLGTAVIAPTLALPMAALAAWNRMSRATGLRDGRWRRAALAAVGLLAGVGAIVAIVPSLPPSAGLDSARSCIAPSLAAASFSSGTDSVGRIVSAAGPFACAVAIFGALANRRRLREPLFLGIVLYAAAPVVVAAWRGAETPRLGAPTLVAFWALVALGLRETVNACSPRAAGRLAAIFFVALLPALPLARRGQVPPPLPDQVPLGHDRVSLNDVARLLAIMPDHSVLVREDAIVDLLLRAEDGAWQKSRKSLEVTGREPTDLAARLAAGPAHVYALPAAARELQNRGFRVVDEPSVRGLVALQFGGACQPIVSAWRDLPDLARASALSLVARTVADEGPVVAYLAFDDRPDPHPLDWPASAAHGFNATLYDTAGPDRARLAADANDDGVPSKWVSNAAPYVVRFELWRTPGAPESLAIGLNTTPVRGLAHIAPEAGPERLSICPAFPHVITPLGGP